MRKSLIAAALLFAVSGCNNDEPAALKVTELTISVMADDGATPVVMTLKCAPAGGDHPQPAEACSKIEEVGESVFEPVPKDQACTMIFGGPQTATVIGTYAGSPINATFSRSNGCEIDRWDKLGTTVFDLPLQ